MKRPSGHSRVRWFAQRRNRRGRVVPMTMHDLDRIAARVAASAICAATRPNALIAAFKRFTKEQGQ